MPVFGGVGEEEAGGGATLECLLGGTAAVVILALVADGIRIGFNRDPDIYLTAFRQQIHIGYDPQQITDLVGQLLQKFFSVRQPNKLSAIVPANVQNAALGIGK